MRALSIRQPWAWLILRPDLQGAARAAWLHSRERKDVENRDWETLYRGPLLVHAGLTLTKKYHAEMAAMLAGDFGLQLPPMDALPRGGIVGVVTVTGCRRDSTSKWFTGPFGFLLANPAPLPFLPMTGKLGYFHVPDADVPGLAAATRGAAHQPHPAPMASQEQ